MLDGETRMMNSRRLLLGLIALFLIPLLACGVFSPTAAPVQPVVITQVVAPTLTVKTSYEALSSEEAVLIELYQQVNPSVVNITVYATATNDQVMPYSQGSGFVYDSEGNIVTNAHLVHGAEQIEVNFFDGQSREARLLG